MYYIECSKRSRVDGLQLVCSPFLSSCCLDGGRYGVLPPCHLCALPGAHSIMLHTLYNIIDIRDFAPVPTPAARYRSYRALQILGILYCLHYI